ncbi:MAG: hypothetical protein ABIR24_02180 [Verrucomicrobiota bacterium]
MKNQIMIALAAVGLITGCATRDVHMAELRDLPMGVQRTIRTYAPDANIAQVEKEHRNGRSVYAVSFEDPARNPELHIASDGALLKGHGPVVIRESSPPVVIHETSRPVIITEGAGATYVPRTGGTRLEDLPVAVQNAIRLQAGGARIVDIDKEVRPGVVYKVQVADPAKTSTLHIAEDGTIVTD